MFLVLFLVLAAFVQCLVNDRASTIVPQRKLTLPAQISTGKPGALGVLRRVMESI
jgi:hypothetical protein